MEGHLFKATVNLSKRVVCIVGFASHFLGTGIGGHERRVLAAGIVPTTSHDELIRLYKRTLSPRTAA